jgi:acyl carrier protein
MTANPVRDFVLREFLPGERPEALGDDVRLITSGLIDSVGTLRLVLFLEETFGITIATEDISGGKLDTLAEIRSLVAARKAP